MWQNLIIFITIFQICHLKQENNHKLVNNTNKCGIPENTFVPWNLVESYINNNFNVTISFKSNNIYLPVQRCRHYESLCIDQNSSLLCGMKNEKLKVYSILFNKTSIILHYLEHDSCKCINYNTYDKITNKNLVFSPTIIKIIIKNKPITKTNINTNITENSYFTTNNSLYNKSNYLYYYIMFFMCFINNLFYKLIF